MLLCVNAWATLKFKVRSPKGKSQFQPSLPGEIHLAIDAAAADVRRHKANGCRAAWMRFQAGPRGRDRRKGGSCIVKRFNSFCTLRFVSLSLVGPLTAQSQKMQATIKATTTTTIATATTTQVKQIKQNWKKYLVSHIARWFIWHLRIAQIFLCFMKFCHQYSVRYACECACVWVCVAISCYVRCEHVVTINILMLRRYGTYEPSQNL